MFRVIRYCSLKGYSNPKLAFLNVSEHLSPLKVDLGRNFFWAFFLQIRPPTYLRKKIVRSCSLTRVRACPYIVQKWQLIFPRVLLIEALRWGMSNKNHVILFFDVLHSETVRIEKSREHCTFLPWHVSRNKKYDSFIKWSYRGAIFCTRLRPISGSYRHNNGHPVAKGTSGRHVFFDVSVEIQIVPREQLFPYAVQLDAPVSEVYQ